MLGLSFSFDVELEEWFFCSTNAKCGGGVLLVQLKDIVYILNYPFIVAAIFLESYSPEGCSVIHPCAVIGMIFFCVDQFVLLHISV